MAWWRREGRLEELQITVNFFSYLFRTLDIFGTIKLEFNGVLPVARENPLK